MRVATRPELLQLGLMAFAQPRFLILMTAAPVSVCDEATFFPLHVPGAFNHV